MPPLQHVLPQLCLGQLISDVAPEAARHSCLKAAGPLPSLACTSHCLLLDVQGQLIPLGLQTFGCTSKSGPAKQSAAAVTSTV